MVMGIAMPKGCVGGRLFQSVRTFMDAKIVYFFNLQCIPYFFGAKKSVSKA